ncbi:unnamed protein product [Heligmosomoides polygyrus]|uniref:Secreted protein n=1 Tax=Heligmosomoides polygyrus TaxID=6339 RepID=A0A183G1R9_HELPZ|nr:unnamed protein product [Heligmosomoides polygyrus]
MLNRIFSTLNRFSSAPNYLSRYWNSFIKSPLLVLVQHYRYPLTGPGPTLLVLVPLNDPLLADGVVGTSPDSIGTFDDVFGTSPDSIGTFGDVLGTSPDPQNTFGDVFGTYSESQAC